jgi:hypothetical protein
MKSAIYMLAVLLLLGAIGGSLLIPAKGKANAAPNLLKQWDNQVYGLDDDEVIRLISAPFTKQRLSRLTTQPNGLRWGKFIYSYNNGTVQPVPSFAYEGNSDPPILWYSSLKRFEINLESEFRKSKVPVDWVVRQGTATEPRMKALASVLSAATGKQLAIEQRMVESDVLVARGRWQLGDVDNPAAAKIYIPGPYRGGPYKQGTLAQSFRGIEDMVGCNIIDEVEGERPQTVVWNPIAHFPTREGRLRAIEVFQQQTSLKLVPQRRPMPIWFLFDRSPTTQPAEVK